MSKKAMFKEGDKVAVDWTYNTDGILHGDVIAVYKSCSSTHSYKVQLSNQYNCIIVAEQWVHTPTFTRSKEDIDKPALKASRSILRTTKTAVSSGAKRRGRPPKKR